MVCGRAERQKVIESLKRMISNKATEKQSFYKYQTRVLDLHQVVESKYRKTDATVRVHEKQRGRQPFPWQIATDTFLTGFRAHSPHLLSTVILSHMH